MPDTQAVQVAAGVVWREGRFLAAKRPEDKPMPGYWEFPGGKREQGESIDQTLRRELCEELGIECRVCVPWTSVIHAYPHMTVEVHFIHVTDFTGTPEARDGQELVWLSPEEARHYPFLPADIQLVDRIRHPLTAGS